MNYNGNTKPKHRNTRKNQASGKRIAEKTQRMETGKSKSSSKKITLLDKLT